jgi:hypothetical protein
MKIEIAQQLFIKFSNIKFHENPTSGFRVVPRMDGRIGRTKEALRIVGNKESKSVYPLHGVHRPCSQDATAYIINCTSTSHR